MKFDHIVSLEQLMNELNDNDINPTMYGYSDFPTFGEASYFYAPLMQCNNNLTKHYAIKDYHYHCRDCTAYSYDKDSALIYHKDKYEIISHQDLNELCRQTNKIESQLRSLTFDKYSCFGLRWDIVDAIYIEDTTPSLIRGRKSNEIRDIYVCVRYFNKEKVCNKMVKLHTMTKFSGMGQDNNLFRRTSHQVDIMRQFMSGHDSDYKTDEVWSKY